jgi:chemotaxis protein MotB
MPKKTNITSTRRMGKIFYPSFSIYPAPRVYNRSFLRCGIYIAALVILLISQSGCLVSASKYRIKSQELDEAMARNKLLADKYESLIDERDKLEEKNALLTSALDAKEKTDKATIGDLNAENKQLREENKKLAVERDDLKVKIVNLAQEKKTEIDNLKTTYKTVVDDIKKEAEADKLQITQLENKLTVSIVDKILFESGQVELKKAGRDVLKRIGNILKKMTGQQIKIEGYTDNVPIGKDLISRYPTNWELSAARAINVAKYLQAETDIDPSLLVVCAYSQYRPIADNSTSEGKAKNRRIEIVLVPMDFEPVEQTSQEQKQPVVKSMSAEPSAGKLATPAIVVPKTSTGTGK